MSDMGRYVRLPFVVPAGKYSPIAPDQLAFGAAGQSAVTVGGSGGAMEFDLVRRLGVLVDEREDLEDDVCYVDNVRLVDEDGHRWTGLALIRKGLPAQTRREVADWLLSEVATTSVPAS